MANRARSGIVGLVKEIEALNPDKQAEVLAFVRSIQGGAVGAPTAEDRAWRDARLTQPLPSYDWGKQDPLAGSPVRWDPKRSRIVVDAPERGA